MHQVLGGRMGLVGSAGGERHGPGREGCMRGRGDSGQPGAAAVPVQAPCLQCPHFLLRCLPSQRGSISEKGKASLRVSGFLRTAFTSSQNCLPQTHPRPRLTHIKSPPAGPVEGAGASSLRGWGGAVTSTERGLSWEERLLRAGKGLFLAQTEAAGQLWRLQGGRR